MIPLFGYGMALLMGVCLGLLGSGGSILTVPVLVYMFRFTPVVGTAYSLFIVGLTSLVGLLVQIHRGKVRVAAALTFLVPSLAGVYLVRGHIIHGLSETLHLPLGMEIPRDTFIMSLFALVMAAAALSMLYRKSPDGDGLPDAGFRPRFLRACLIGMSGLLVGGLTGFVGAGGGFLIVPVMMLLARLPMELAVGTSLAVITAQSLVGFAADWTRMGPVDWRFLFSFSLLSMVGVLAGGLLGRRMGGEKLRFVFGWLVLTLSLVILSKEIFA